MAQKKQKRQPTGDYPIGYCRPPAQHRFRAGQSGNSTGQRKGSHVKTTADELKEIAETKITVRRDGRTQQLSLAAANLLAHATNGAKGDVRSASLFLKHAQEMGLFDGQGSGDLQPGASGKPHRSDILLEGLDPSLLSRDEQVELSNLVAIINRDSSIWALSASELERFRVLVHKDGSNGVSSGSDNGGGQ